MSVESPAVSSMSRSDADILDQVQEPLFYGAASPSLEKRIHESDAIVRASLSSTDSGELRFGVAEYLKGTGQSEIVVMAETATRNTTWDDREAILFLTLRQKAREPQGPPEPKELDQPGSSFSPTLITRAKEGTR